MIQGESAHFNLVVQHVTGLIKHQQPVDHPDDFEQIGSLHRRRPRLRQNNAASMAYLKFRALRVNFW